MSSILSGIVSVAADAQAPEGWQKVADDETYGAVYSADPNAQGLRMLVKSRRDVERSCSCNLDAEAGDDPEQILLFALSTMWIDVAEHTFADAAMVGEAMTEFGGEAFRASIEGAARQQRVVVVIGPAKQVAAFRKSDGAARPRRQSVQASTSRPQAASSAAATPKAVTNDAYPEPVFGKDSDGSRYVTNWTTNGTVQLARANDVHAPRLQTEVLAFSSKRSPVAQMKTVLAQSGLTAIKFVKVERVEVTNKIMGIQFEVAFGTAKRKGKAVRFHASHQVDKQRQSAVVKAYDAPTDIYVAWGAVAVPMTLASIYETKDWNEAALNQAGGLSPVEEAAIFEDHYTKKMMSLFSATMSTKAATLNSMRSFNMSTAACAGVENCNVTPDGTGEYQAETE